MIIHALPRATRGSDNSQCQFTCLHAPTWISHALNTPTRYMRHALTRAFSTTTSCMTSSSIPRSDPFIQLTRFDQDQPKNLTQSKLLEIIFKKKWEKKMLWPNEPLTLTKKSKFSKGACPTLFFTYIPILESVSLLKTRKLCKLSKFQKVDFWTNLDQKVKNFKKDLSCPIFREDSDFWVYFFIWESKIAQKVWFCNCWL